MVSGASAVDPDGVLAALGEARSGNVYDLATILSSEMAQGNSDVFPPFQLTPYRTPRAILDQASPPPFDFSTELVSGSVHAGTHIDGLAHIHSSGRMHGPISTKDAYSDFGWKANGAETILPIVMRGIILDIPRLLGISRLEDGHEITIPEVVGACELQGVNLNGPTAVLVRTGKIVDFHRGGSAYFDRQPGVGMGAAIWLFERGMRLLGSDTSGTEPHPIRDENRTTHAAMLVERGVHLLEILDLEELASVKPNAFALICLPLKIVGATGSWVRPIAIT